MRPLAMILPDAPELDAEKFKIFTAHSQAHSVNNVNHVYFSEPFKDGPPLRDLSNLLNMLTKQKRVGVVRPIKKDKERI